MPAEDRTGITRGDGRPPAAAEPGPSRRSVLRSAAGAGAAGLAASALAGLTGGPAMASAAAARPAVARQARPGAAPAPSSGADVSAGEDIVVHLRDARSGDLDVFSGTSHIRLRDPDLAARLVRATAPADKLAR